MSEVSRSQQETLARLAQSRAEIRRLLEPPPRPVPGAGDAAGTAPGQRADGAFPRSRTMRLLMSAKGLGTAGAVVGGLLLARPALAWRLVRLVPLEAVARVLLGKAMNAMRSKSQ